jgi:hypothetical protein
MTLLLQNRGDEVRITEQTIKAAATSGQEAVLEIIEEYLNILPGKKKWLRLARLYNAAKNGDEEVTRNLLAPVLVKKFDFD